MEAKSRGPGPKINLREDKMDNATLERMVQERCAAFAPPVAAAPAAPIPVLVPAREDPIDMETLSQLVDMRAALMPEDQGAPASSGRGRAERGGHCAHRKGAGAAALGADRRRLSDGGRRSTRGRDDLGVDPSARRRRANSSPRWF
jgi:hypothetical protein